MRWLPGCEATFFFANAGILVHGYTRHHISYITVQVFWD